MDYNPSEAGQDAMLSSCADKSHNLLQYAPLLYHVVGGSEHICHFMLLILELLPIWIDISSFLALTFYSKVFLKCKKICLPNYYTYHSPPTLS